jgi:hypothetical protein
MSRATAVSAQDRVVVRKRLRSISKAFRRAQCLSGANSYLKLKASPAGAGGVTLEFVAASNKTYSVQFKDDPAGEGWHTLTRFPARSTNSVQVGVDGQSRPQRYYRLVTPGDR